MTTARTTYKPELDGIRAICIIFTVANHVPGTPWAINGSVGVDVFFALSGWLITWLLIHDGNEDRASKLASYYIRRIFRIVPLYALTVILYGLAASAHGLMTGTEAEIIDFRAGFPYFATFNGEYMHHETGTLFGHSWTLGIEEKFYIIWPLVMIFLFDSRTVGVAVLGLAIVSLIWLGQHPELLIRGYAGLSFGAALAVAASRSGSLAAYYVGSRRTAYWALVGMFAAYVCSLILPHPFAWNVCIAFFAAGLIGSLWLKDGGFLRRILSLRPLAAVGRLTYAIYLTHVLVMNVVLMALAKLHVTLPWLVAFIISYVASVALALVLHHMIEVPLIEVGRKAARRSSRRLQKQAESTVIP